MADRLTCKKKQSQASSKGGIITQESKLHKNIHDFRTMIQSICEGHHEAAALTLVFYNMRQVFY